MLASLQSSSPVKTILTWNFENGILVDDVQSQIGISEHITPQTHVSSTAELKLSPYSSKSTRSEAQEPTLNTLSLSASLSLLLMSLISKPVFGKLNVGDNAMKIFWSRYHCELLITTLSLYTGLSFHTTPTKTYYFHSFQDQKLQNLLSWQHPLLWIVLPNRANLAEVAWNPLEGWEIPPVLH